MILKKVKKNHEFTNFNTSNLSSHQSNQLSLGFHKKAVFDMTHNAYFYFPLH